jgi:hypothetical protein
VPTRSAYPRAPRRDPDADSIHVPGCF